MPILPQMSSPSWSPRQAFGWVRLGLLLAWMAAWMGLTWAISRTPPLDNAEQLTWVRQLAWGYYKHPPLPTAFLWPWVQVFGIQEWVTYAAAAVVTGAGMVVAWRLVAALLGERLADIALLSTLCNVHYTQRLAHFNHDVLLMPCVGLAALCCWHAFERRSRIHWAGVGLALGLGALAKYQVALAAVSLLTWWLLERGWSDRVHRQGLVLATALAVLIVAPNLAWVVGNDYLPLRYVADNSLSSALDGAQATPTPWKWIGDQLGMGLGSLLMLAGLFWWGRARPRVQPSGDLGADLPAHSQEEQRLLRPRRFLLCWGVLPLALIPLIGLVLHARLHANWADAYLPLTCAALLAVWRSAPWRRWGPRPIGVAFALVQCVLVGVTLSQVHREWPGLNLSAHPRRFASQQLADQIGPDARAALGGAIRVIAGPYRLAGVLSLRLAERPLVWIDGRHDISPWVPDELPRRCGVLWVGTREQAPPAGVAAVPFGDGLWWGVQRAEAGRGCGRQAGG